MVDVFVSYAQEDRLKATAIVELFSTVGWTTWWDRNIAGGEEWSPEILEKVNEAKSVVVLWSRDSTKKEWVIREAQVGVENNTLVPVLLQPASIETPTPEIQAVRLATWTGDRPDELRPLLDAVASKLGVSSPLTSESDEVRFAADRTARAIGRVEVAQVVFDYCAVAFTHEVLRRGGHRFSQEEFQAKRDAYDDLQAALAPEGGKLNKDDLHELMGRFMNVLLPEED